jgi:aminopeptidase N
MMDITISHYARNNQLKVVILLLIAQILLINISIGQNQSKSPVDSLDAVHYEIRIYNIDFTAKSISASATVFLTPLSGPVPVINLELIELTVTNVWVDNIPVTNFTQSDSLLGIPLVTALQPGDTIAVKVEYNGIPFHESWGGFHFSGEYAFNLGVGISMIPHNLGKSWYPCVDNFTDRATYDVFCTLPDGKIAIGGGLLAEVTDNGNGTNTYHWNLAQTVPTYLSSIAAGNYVAVNDTFNGMNGPVPINIYVRPQDTSRVEGTFINLKEILAIFEDCMGPYSWDRVGYTTAAIGSMEHATNIFIPHSFLTGSTTYESTIAHELTHMWMGDEVTCSSAQEMWINEGWATFFGSYYALALYGDQEAYKLEMRNKHASVLQYCHTSSGDGSYFPLNQIPQEYTYGMSAYDRGATVTQALRFYLGDSLFFETLTAFIDEFSFQDASSYDMRDFMTGYTGIDMSGFFNNFVLNSGTPHYSVDSFNVAMKDKSLYDVTVYVRQKRKGPSFTADGNIMEVMFMDENRNTYTDTIHFNGHSGSSVKTLPFWPTVVLVDPEEKMCDATTDNYKNIKTTGNYNFLKTYFSLEVTNVSDSAFIQVTHNWVPPDSLNEPVAGLRLSDYRYWRIDGIIPEDFQATGKFFYSRDGFLDNTLITSSSDTVIILYRGGAMDDWQEIDFDKIGPWNIGNILVNDLKPGEYSLAVKEASVGGSELRLPGNKILDIYPNPSSGNFTIQSDTDTGGDIRIYSDSGILVKAFPVSSGRERITWSPVGLAAGSYLIALYQEGRPGPEIQMAFYLP